MSSSCAAVEACLQAEEANKDHADDATWVLTSSFVILTMQSGFGLLEMGSSSPGFEVNIMTKNAMDVVFGALTYWFVGYGLSYGEPSNPFCGQGQFMPDEGYSNEESGLIYSRYIFQFSFAATATTIVSGAVAMRMKFLIYCFYSVWAIIVYSFVAHWIWAPNGWLNTMGVHDFAGGGPVHLLGGINALVAAVILGPRTGYFKRSRDRADFAATSPASTLFGLFMLWWGWIGFNCGSTFGITGDRWIVATRAAMTTINASAAGGAVSLLYTLRKTKWKQVRVHHLVNGILGALVATSPTCAVTHSWQSLVIGAIAAIFVNLLNTFVKRFKIDDPVGAVGVHAGGALWGLIAVGLFADSQLPGVDVMDGLFAGGGWKLLGLQVLAAVSIIGWSFVTVTPFFYLTGVVISKNWKDPRTGLRLSEEDELLGEDRRLHGIDLPYDASIRFSTAGSDDELDSEDELDKGQDFGQDTTGMLPKPQRSNDTNPDNSDEYIENPRHAGTNSGSKGRSKYKSSLPSRGALRAAALQSSGGSMYGIRVYHKAYQAEPKLPGSISVDSAVHMPAQSQLFDSFNTEQPSIPEEGGEHSDDSGDNFYDAASTLNNSERDTDIEMPRPPRRQPGRRRGAQSKSLTSSLRRSGTGVMGIPIYTNSSDDSERIRGAACSALNERRNKDGYVANGSHESDIRANPTIRDQKANVETPTPPRPTVGFSGVGPPENDERKQSQSRRMIMKKKAASSRRGFGALP